MRDDPPTPPLSFFGTRTAPENIDPLPPCDTSISLPPLESTREDATEVGVFSVTVPRGLLFTGVTSMGVLFNTKLEAVLCTGVRVAPCPPRGFSFSSCIILEGPETEVPARKK